MDEHWQPMSKLDRVIHYLVIEFEGYPYQPEKDQKYFQRLLAEFTEIDIEDELRQYHAWVLDQPDTKKIYYRSRFRSWLKTTMQFKKNPTQKIPHWLRRSHAQAAR